MRNARRNLEKAQATFDRAKHEWVYTTTYQLWDSILATMDAMIGVLERHEGEDPIPPTRWTKCCWFCQDYDQDRGKCVPYRRWVSRYAVCDAFKVRVDG